MKKYLLILLGVLTCVSLSACGGSDTSTSNNSNSSGNDGNSEVASNWPEKAIQLIVPFGAGGDTDLNARLFAKYLSEELGKGVGVSNVSGAAGMLGAQQVIDSQPDGYTTLWSHTEVLIPYLAGTSDIEIHDMDVAGIGMLTDTTVLAVRADAPYQTVEELVSAAQSNPGGIEFAMSTGGYPHLIGIALEEQLGVDFNLVHVGGNADKMTALLGGHTDVINVEYALAKDYFDNGDFTCLAVLSEERNPLFSEIPTLTEMGYDVVFNKFFFFGFPKGTPTDVIETFSTAMESVVNNPDFQAECAEFYITPTYMNQKDAMDYIEKVNTDLAVYGQLFRDQVE